MSCFAFAQIYLISISFINKLISFVTNKKDAVRSYGSVLDALGLGLMSALLIILFPLFIFLMISIQDTANAAPGINEQINFQARLLNSDGSLVDDGNYNVEFNIYSGGDGVLGGGDETLEWTEEHINNSSNGITVKNGYLYVQLGSVTAFGSSVDWNEDTLWLSMNIGNTNGTCTPFTNCAGDGEMTPFLRFSSVPYAFNAGQLDGLDSGDFAQLAQGEQAVNSASTVITVDQAGAGDLIDLQVSNSSVFTVSNAGNTVIGGTLQAGATTLTSTLDVQGSSITVGQASTTDGTLIFENDTNAFTTTLAVTDATADRTITLPDATGTVLLDSTLATTAFIQNGNSFGASAVLGTNDTQSLIFETDGTTAITVDTSQDTTFAGNLVVTAQKTITLTGGTTAQRPGSPTEGMLYFDTDTDSLLTYANGKWQADRTTATKIVAANDSTQAAKDSADYVADGTADEVQINAALTATAGGRVYLIEGTYNLASSIDITSSDTTLSGAGNGTVITQSNGTNLNSTEFIDITGALNVTVENLKIDGNNTNNTGTVVGIRIASNSHDALIQNNSLEDVGGMSIHVLSGSRARIIGNIISNSADNAIQSGQIETYISSNNIASSTNNGIRIFNDRATIINNIIDTTGSVGIRMDGSQSTISGNTVVDAGTYGIALWSFSTDYSTVSNNIVSNSGDIGISILSTNNSIIGNTVEASGSIGLEIGDAYNFVVGNGITNSTEHGIQVFGSNSVISDNIIHNSGGANNFDGINVSADNTQITNNRITDTAGTGFAINIGAASRDNTYLADNTFSGTGATTINDSGTNTIYANQLDGAITDNTANLEIQAPSSGAIQLLSNTDITGTLTVSSTATFNGDVTIATGNQFTNASSTLFTAIAISDLPTGGNIGTAAATVDVATSFNVNQTTASQAITLPSPTDTTAGRIVFVNNVGSADFTMYSNPINSGSSSSFMWNGTSWVQTISYTSTGVESIGAIDSQTKSANGAVKVGTVLYLQTADASYPGLVSTGAQTFAGAKTFSGLVNADGGIAVDTSNFTVDGTTGAVVTASTLDVQGVSVTVGQASTTDGTIIFENDTNAFTTTLAVIDATADRTITLPNETGTVLLDTTLGTTAFLQNGNSFGATAVLGTNDTQDLQFETDGTLAVTIDTNQDVNFTGSVTLAAQQTLTLTGGTTAQRPGSPTEGMLHFDTDTDSLLIYANGKWQADRTTATKIVAANDSTQAAKDSADYVADGTSDETEINSALSALPANGGVVYLLDGSYVIDGTIDLNSNESLQGSGEGTIITIPDAHNSDIDIISILAETNTMVSSITIDSNNTNQSSGDQKGIYITGNENSIDNVKILDTSWYGIHITSDDNAVQNTSIDGSGSAHIYISGETNRISNNNLTNGGYGISAPGSNNIIEQNVIDGGSVGVSVNGLRNIVTDNQISNNTSNGIVSASTGGYNTIQNNMLYNNGGAVGNNSIQIFTDNNNISGNTIIDTAGTGYAVGIVAGADNNYLADNTYSGTGATEISDAGTNTIYANQLDGAISDNTANLLIQAPSSGEIELLSNTTLSGSLTISGVATDITTGTDEDLTVVANGTGVIVLNDTVQIPTLAAADSDTVLCRNTSNQLATCNNTFLTTEADTLATVTGRGATTTTLVNLDGGIAVDTSNFTVSGTTGDILTAGDLAVNGGNITSTSALSVDIADTNSFTITDGTNTLFTIADGGAVGNATISGTLAVNGDSITADGATLTINAGGDVDIQDDVTVDSLTTDTGDITSAGDVAVNGGDITTDDATANLFNVTPTTINIGGVATTIELGAATGTTSINNNLTVDGNTTLGTDSGDTLTVNATSTFNTNLDVALADAEDVTISSTVTGTAGNNVLEIDLTNNTTSGTQRAANITNLDGTGVTETLLYLSNDDPDTAVTDGIFINAAAGGIGTAIDVSDTQITTALSVGANTISGTTADLDFTNFDVTGSNGNIVTAGTLAVNGDSITADGATLTINAGGAVDIQDALTADSLTLDTGSLTISGVATDITTGTDEDLTVVANGTGVVILNDTVQIQTLGAADTFTHLCRNSSNEIATCNTTGAGAAFVQGGNTFGATAILGTDDTYSLQIETDGTLAVTIDTSQNTTLAGDLSVNGSSTLGDANTDTTTIRGQITLTDSSATYPLLFGGDVNLYRGGADLLVTADSLTVSEDLGVNGGDIVTSQTTFNLINTAATTLNIGGAATTIELGAATGTTSVNNNLSIDGNSTLGADNTDLVYINGLVATDITYVEGATRNLTVETRSTNAAGNDLTVSAGSAGAGAGAFSGGALNLQGGDAAGTGNADGGNVVLGGGAGVGTGTQGLVVLENAAFNSVVSATCGTDCTITLADIDAYSNVVVEATATMLEIIVPNPSITTAGRVMYITAADGTNEFTLTLNDGEGSEVNIGLRENETATLIWNGSDWTGAGASSSTTLQSAYNNTLTSAGGAELILNAAGGAADGLTIRNNDVTPITGGILEVQSSIGTNLFSVNNLGTELAANGGSETLTGWGTDWSSIGAGVLAARTTTSGEYATGLAAAEVTTNGAINDGIRNNLSANPVVSTTYTVSFTAKLDTGTFSTLEVAYSRDGGTDFEICSTYSTQTITTTGWTKITCTITTDSTTATNPDLIIRQTDAATRTFWVENLSFQRNDGTTEPSNVQIGGGTYGGPVTLFTLDRASAPPVADGNETFLGSMYYDTVTGRIQCYESDGWGACGSPPNNIITLTPEYAGAVLNGGATPGVGTMTADFCSNQSGVLQINSTLCDSGEAVNYYAWTSPQATAQTYSVLLTFQLPNTFDTFIDNNTITLDARTTNTGNSDVDYEIFRSTGSSITECGSNTTVTSLDDTWQTVAHNGNEQSSCSFAGGDRVIFKLNMVAQDNDTVYVSDINFTYTND